MVWAKFEDDYPMNRKTRRLTDAEFRLDVSGVCWAAKYLTNGLIRNDELDLISDVKNPRRVAAGLVTKERWSTHPDGWEIHDFLDYNPSAEDVRDKREKRARAGSIGGKRSSESRATLKAVGEANA